MYTNASEDVLQTTSVITDNTTTTPITTPTTTNLTLTLSDLADVTQGMGKTLTVALQRVFSSAIIISVNLLTMVTFSRVRTLRTLSNKLVICLASTDLMVGVITFISALVWVPGLGEFIHFSPESCVVRLCWFFMCCSASMVNISIIALERYLYIVHPYLHVQYVTPKVVKGCVGFVWVFGITFGSCPVFFAEYDKPELGCDFYLLLGYRYVVWGTCSVFFSTSLLTLFFYSLIARLALKMRRAVGSFHQTTAASNDARLASLRMALTSIKAPVVVFGVFVICWSPHISVYLFHHFAAPLPQNVRGWFTTAGLFNSAMNFFVYLTLNAQFRRAVLDYFRRKGGAGGGTGSSGSSASDTSRKTTSSVFAAQRHSLQHEGHKEEEMRVQGKKHSCEVNQGVDVTAHM